MMDKCETEFEYSNTVTRIFESPRVTKPYRDDQWEAIYQLGRITSYNVCYTKLLRVGLTTGHGFDRVSGEEQKIVRNRLEAMLGLVPIS